MFQTVFEFTHSFCCRVFDRMREVDLGGGRALLIKQRGEFSAIGHKCPHYGAPLVKGEGLVPRWSFNIPNVLKYQKGRFFLLSGVLSKGHVRCPWHGACFNIATGDIEDFPGLDSLPTFQVTLSPVPCLIAPLSALLTCLSALGQS